MLGNNSYARWINRNVVNVYHSVKNAWTQDQDIKIPLYAYIHMYRSSRTKFLQPGEKIPTGGVPRGQPPAQPRCTAPREFYREFFPFGGNPWVFSLFVNFLTFSCIFRLTQAAAYAIILLRISRETTYRYPLNSPLGIHIMFSPLS